MGDDNNIFGIGDHSMLDKFITMLDRQTDTKLTPVQLMGMLSLYSLLGILDLMRGTADTGIKDISALASLSSLAGKAAKSPEGPAIKDALMGLLGGQNQSGSDLGALLNMVGGNKKINPQMLLTLMSLLNSQSGAAKGEQSVAKVGTVKTEGAPREKVGEVQKDKSS